MFFAQIEWASSVVGVVGPVLTALITIPIYVIIKRLEANHDVTKEEGDQTRSRLKEAEGVIRGDLANGLKASIDSVNDKIDAQDVASKKVASDLENK
jgi:hypothetical protein